MPPIRNQHLPFGCGSCWAHAVTTSLSARLRITRGDDVPFITLSPQYLLNCGGVGSCQGGDIHEAMEFIEYAGAVDDTCLPYLATERQCDAWGTCYTCTHDGTLTGACAPISAPDFWHLQSWKSLERDTTALMTEILEHGPIVCSVSLPAALMAWDSCDVFVDETGLLTHDHDVVLRGWGVDDAGREYWEVTNSWGTHWGCNGSFKLIRGAPGDLGVESMCVSGVPEKQPRRHPMP
jgi:hypothetical protein|eukprot:gnl/Ergobibamus_cyprinoides/150.p2 GENE.gnl/Ergobibamus_cyprinoides/150~~gnl/Ergobibamus_cyprinoides/150.p2  ORF type:complete len:236 (+),score=50.80 gnl/Ergobibamus_cyprinoides/150:162-869(+)